MSNERHTVRKNVFKATVGVINKSANLEAVNDAIKDGKEKTTDNGYSRLHVVFDKRSYAMLKWLMVEVEASSETEVIRRALKAATIFEPSFWSGEKLQDPNLESIRSGLNKNQHLYVRLPTRTMERMESTLQQEGLSYSEQIRQALCIFVQLVRNLDKNASYLTEASSRKKSDDKNHLDQQRKSLTSAISVL